MTNRLPSFNDLVQDPELQEHFEKVKDDIANNELAASFTQLEEEFIEDVKEEFMPAPEKPVSSNLWDILAGDLVLGKADKYSIAHAYELSPEQMDDLLGNETFLKLLEEKQRRVKGLGEHASFVMKMQALAEDAIPHVAMRLRSPETSTRDFCTLYSKVVELAKLVPKEESRNTGTTINFQIQGVPGLTHLNAPATKTIDLPGAHIQKPKQTIPADTVPTTDDGVVTIDEL